MSIEIYDFIYLNIWNEIILGIYNKYILIVSFIIYIFAENNCFTY